MSERVALGELVTLRRGSSYKGEMVGLPGPALLGLGTINRNGGFRPENVRTYGGPTSDKILLTAGDIYVSLKDVTHAADLLGAIARVPPSIRTGRLTQDTVRVDVKDSLVDRQYLYLTLQSPEYRAYCKALGTGTTNLDLSPSDFLAFQIRLPNRTEQIAIAEVLGALDDKIAANTKLISASEDLARSTFQSASSRGPRIPLSEIAAFVNGKAFTKGASGTGRVVIRIAELNSGLGGSTVFSDAEVAAQHVAEPGDILFAWSGSLTLHRWYRAPGIVNQHIFKVIPKSGYPAWLAFQAIAAKLDDFKSTAADKATTMGHIQRHHLDELVRVPDAEGISKIDQVLTGLWSSALTAETENITLATIRDTLLPQLMSGKLRVRDAERTVSEVL